MSGRTLPEIVDRIVFSDAKLSVLEVSAQDPPLDVDTLIGELIDELEFSVEDDNREVQRVQAERSEGGGYGATEALLTRLKALPPSDIVVVQGIGQLEEQELRRLDTARNHLQFGPSLVLVVATDEVKQLAHFAPNLWSWVAPASGWRQGRLRTHKSDSRVSGTQRTLATKRSFGARRIRSWPLIPCFRSGSCCWAGVI